MVFKCAFFLCLHVCPGLVSSN